MLTANYDDPADERRLILSEHKVKTMEEIGGWGMSLLDGLEAIILFL